MAIARIATPLGVAVIEGDEEGVSRLSISEGSVAITDEIPGVLREAGKQLEEYFSGKRQEFELKMKPEGTEFQKKVWKELQSIPFGKTVSYFELSRKLGDIKAIRAVASANGRNPLWVLVPCHRVIGSDGSLTGYAGGLWRKKWLLAHENPVKQGSLFQE